MIDRRNFAGQLTVLMAVGPAAVLAESSVPLVKVYKSATCGCCNKWVDHLRAAGFEVEATNVQDVNVYKREYGVPPRLASCHTALVAGYVVEGHVPVDDIIKMLRQEPGIAGIAVPGMPLGSPGMEAPNPVRYETLSFSKDGTIEIFAVHEP